MKIPVKIVDPNTTAGSQLVDAKFFRNKLADVTTADKSSSQPLPMTQAEFNKLA
jgi:hypothetical protein